MTPYSRLEARFEKIATVQEAQAVLDWDAAAMMPPGGASARADQLAVLAGVAHEILTAEETGSALYAAESGSGLDEWQAANLGLMRHAFRRATALPNDFVLAQTRSQSICEKVWREARQTSNFALVAPYLVEVVAMAREAAGALGEALGLAPYDALMDGYQRGITCADVDPIFTRYTKFLERTLPGALAMQARSDQPLPLVGPYPADLQEGMCRHLSARAGLSFVHARLDRSAHPFCGGTPTDVRITTRYNESDLAVALMGVLHETGHALYERGLPEGSLRQPVGMAAGMAVHESQALILEMQACRSDGFLGWLGPELHGMFGGDPGLFAGDNLVRLWRRVQPGFIRVDADEMTYPAHIIIRFDLERALIEDRLQVADLPYAWRDAMQSMLGIEPPDDARGCLQDIHWYFGGFGYFPSYTLGAMAAAQFMSAARRAVPDLDAGFARGDLRPLAAWLRAHVQGHGSRFDLNTLMQQATGEALDPKHFEKHLLARYVDGNAEPTVQPS